MKELIAWLRANPDKAAAATVGAAGGAQVSAIYFQQATGTRFRFVPYRGGGPAVQDMLSDRVDLMLDQAANALGQVRAGTIKAYAVMAKARWWALPDVPAIANALATLDALAAGLAPRVEALHVDLADLRGYHYHNGPIFSVYTAGEPNAIGKGGRYDGVGKAFGRARPATGFTLDLRQLADVLARG